MIAIYDLSREPTTFDFAVWAVMAKTSGAKAVHFIAHGPIADWKYHPSVAWKRFGAIVIPICDIAKLPYTVGARQEGAEFNYNYGDIEKLYRETGKIAKLKQQYDIEPGYMTITLRKSFRNAHRNSNEQAWFRFREYLEGAGKRVAVLPECEQAPLDLGYRMALYANAEMNFGTSNGPMALCHMSEAPYLTLNMCPADPTGKSYDLTQHMIKTGFPPGSQFSFKNDRQLIVWKPDTYENIVEAYAKLS